MGIRKQNGQPMNYEELAEVYKEAVARNKYLEREVARLENRETELIRMDYKVDKIIKVLKTLEPYWMHVGKGGYIAERLANALVDAVLEEPK